MIEWLAATPWSVALRESHYVFLGVLTVHVMTLFVFAGTAAVIDLRLAGLMMRQVPAAELLSRLLPWAAGGLAVMVTSGLLLFYASPLDRVDNLFFRVKLALLAAALVNVLIFHKTGYRQIAGWSHSVVPPRSARLAGIVGLVLWVGIIVMGRMIPYQRYWF